MDANLSRRHAVFKLARCASLGSMASLVACTGLMGPPRVAYSEAELNQMLMRRFPLRKRVGEVLELSLANPRLSLRAGAGRLATEFDLSAEERLLGHRWTGQLALEYGLRLQRDDHSLRLDSPWVTRLVLDNKTGNPQVERLGALAIEQMLNDLVVVKMKPEQIDRLAQAGYELGDVTVGPNGVEITSRPRR